MARVITLFDKLLIYGVNETPTVSKSYSIYVDAYKKLQRAAQELYSELELSNTERPADLVQHIAYAWATEDEANDQGR
jgi:hypothetical protein